MCGAILLNAACDKVVLVQSMDRKRSWGFPKGKINQGESKYDCAVREVYEETDYDISPLGNEHHLIEYAFFQTKIVTLFIVVGVPEEAVASMAPRTRMEVSGIKWWPLKELLDNAKLRGMLGAAVPSLLTWLNRKPGKKLRRERMRAQGLSEREIEASFEATRAFVTVGDAESPAQLAAGNDVLQILRRESSQPQAPADPVMANLLRQLAGAPAEAPAPPLDGGALLSALKGLEPAEMPGAGTFVPHPPQPAPFSDSLRDFRLDLAPIMACFDG